MLQTTLVSWRVWSTIVMFTALWAAGESSQALAQSNRGGGGTSYAYSLSDLLGFGSGDFQSQGQFILDRIPIGQGSFLIEIVGSSRIQLPAGTVFHPALWQVDQAGTTNLTDLGLPSFAKEIETTGLNELGMSVGVTRIGIPPAEGGDGTTPQFLYTPGFGYTRLPNGLGGFEGGWVDDLNDLGQIVGTPHWAIAGEDGALWQTDFQGGVSEPIILEEFKPAAINNHGVMAGTSLGWLAIGWFANNQLQVRSMNGTQRFFGPMVSAINDRAFDDPLLAVVATSSGNDSGNRVAKDSERGIVWRANQATNATTILGTLGGDDSYAFDVNCDGIVVGYADTKSSGQQAFVFKNGTMTSLNTQADVGRRVLQRAWSINESGDIVGFMRVPVGGGHEQRGYVLRKNGA